MPSPHAAFLTTQPGSLKNGARWHVFAAVHGARYNGPFTALPGNEALQMSPKAKEGNTCVCEPQKTGFSRAKRSGNGVRTIASQ